MKKIGLLLSLVVGLSLAFALLWVLEVQSNSAMAEIGAGHVGISDALAAELHVCPSGCTYSSVQAAVDAASAGDIIKVATGIYTGVSTHLGVKQVVYVSKTVSILGGYRNTNWMTPDPEINPTTLDAQGQGRVIFITGDIKPIIEGFRITGGEGKDLGGDPGAPAWDLGGGVYVITATAIISNNQIVSNTCSSNLAHGGGLSLVSSDSMVSGNTFSFNSTGWGGGGLWAGWSNPTVSDNLFIHNSADYGGGIATHESGGTFSGNIFTSNTAKYGGGFDTHVGTEMILNNVINENHASNSGGGMFIHGSSPQLLNNTIARNTSGDGSGVYVTQSFFGNYSTVSLTNTILVDHGVGISVTGGNKVTANAVLWYSTPITVSQSITADVVAHNQHTDDPAFTVDGYHLTAASAAIDKGVEASITVDIDGQPRPAGAGLDLGADELWYEISLPLVIRQ